MTQDRLVPQNAGDLLVRTEKRLTALERRRGTAGEVVSIIGPAQNSKALLIGDWNDPVAANNGYVWSKPGALHAPDGVRTWTGSVVCRSDNSGMQEVWNTDDLNDVRYNMRTFTDDGTGQGRTYSDWRSWATPSGLIELPDLGVSIEDLLAEMAADIDSAAVALSFFEQDSEPVPGVSGVPATIKVGSVWVDTNDNRHTYSWDGDSWVSIESTLFASIDAELALQQAAIEAAATAADDAMDFAVTLNKTYRASSAPTNPDSNGRALVAQDTWFDTSTSLNEMKRWSGSAWVSADVGFTDADLATPTVTGGIIQTIATANEGVKITSGGLTAYNSSTHTATLVINASTGAITMLGALTSGSTVDGAIVTGGTLQTEATTGRGVKINSGGLILYAPSPTAASTPIFTLNAATGAITLDGSVSALTLSGAVVTGGTVQTTATAARGIKVTSTGLIAYDNSGVTKVTIDATTGVITAAGGVLSGGSVTGSIVTGGTLQSEATAGRGVKIDSSGLVLYAPSPAAAGSATLILSASTGSLILIGDMTGGGTITGPVFQTSATGQRIVIDGPGDIINFFSGVATETAGSLDPVAAIGSKPAIILKPGTLPGWVRPSLTLTSGAAASLATITASATTITGDLTAGFAGGSSQINGDVVMPGHLTVTGTGWQNVSFAATWSNFGNPFQPAQYKRVGNRVTLRGLVVSSAPTTPSTIFTLPAGYRVASNKDRIFAPQDFSAGGNGRIDIKSSGNVDFVSGNAGYLSLDGIEFDID